MDGFFEDVGEYFGGLEGAVEEVEDFAELVRLWRHEVVERVAGSQPVWGCASEFLDH